MEIRRLSVARELWFTEPVSILHAVLFGVVEGLSEFLPVSSTAHLILTAKLLAVPGTDFQKTFEIAIQSGAILAVVVLYWKRFLFNRAVLTRVVVAFVPTGVIGFALEKFIRNVLFESIPTILTSLFIGGIAIILFERLHTEGEDSAKQIGAMTTMQAFWIGCIQALAVIPGVSRSAATVLGGEAVGLTRKTAVDFSFLLAAPTMAAATALELFHARNDFTSANLTLLSVGFAASFIVALLAIRWLISFVKRHSFAPFGVYRIAISMILAGGAFFGLIAL